MYFCTSKNWTTVSQEITFGYLNDMRGAQCEAGVHFDRLNMLYLCPPGDPPSPSVCSPESFPIYYIITIDPPLLDVLEVCFYLKQI